MYASRFTSKAKKALEISLECARELGHSVVDSEHILLGLSKEGEGIASKVLINLGITSKDIEDKIIEAKGKSTIVLEDIKKNLDYYTFIIVSVLLSSALIFGYTFYYIKYKLRI